MIKENIDINKLTKNIIISRLDKTIEINKFCKRIINNLKLVILLNKK